MKTFLVNVRAEAASYSHKVKADFFEVENGCYQFYEIKEITAVRVKRTLLAAFTVANVIGVRVVKV